jgi:hypothetical protein
MPDHVSLRVMGHRDAKAVNVPHLTIVFVLWIVAASSASFVTSG